MPLSIRLPPTTFLRPLAVVGASSSKPSVTGSDRTRGSRREGVRLARGERVNRAAQRGRNSVGAGPFAGGRPRDEACREEPPHERLDPREPLVAHRLRRLCCALTVDARARVRLDLSTRGLEHGTSQNRALLVTGLSLGVHLHPLHPSTHEPRIGLEDLARLEAGQLAVGRSGSHDVAYCVHLEPEARHQRPVAGDLEQLVVVI
eukprot:5205433-Prymnesium_polylepis.1